MRTVCGRHIAGLQSHPHIHVFGSQTVCKWFANHSARLCIQGFTRAKRMSHTWVSYSRLSWHWTYHVRSCFQSFLRPIRPFFHPQRYSATQSVMRFVRIRLQDLCLSLPTNYFMHARVCLFSDHIFTHKCFVLYAWTVRTLFWLLVTFRTSTDVNVSFWSSLPSVQVRWSSKVLRGHFYWARPHSSSFMPVWSACSVPYTHRLCVSVSHTRPLVRNPFGGLWVFTFYLCRILNVAVANLARLIYLKSLFYTSAVFLPILSVYRIGSNPALVIQFQSSLIWRSSALDPTLIVLCQFC